MASVIRNIQLPDWKPSLPRTEVPVFTRCCFCLPLRQGLLTFGYVKTLGLVIVAYLLVSELNHFIAREYSPPVMLILFIVWVFIDIIFSLEFIIAGHMKHHQLYQAYYYYSVAFLCVYFVSFIAFVIWNFYDFYRYSLRFVLYIMFEIISTCIPILLLQGYITLLVRSELKKLTTGSNFRFVNNAAEASSSVGTTILVEEPVA